MAREPAQAIHLRLPRMPTQRHTGGAAPSAHQSAEGGRERSAEPGARDTHQPTPLDDEP
jgi:hypothetical protein